jgi:hypothetical protein
VCIGVIPIIILGFVVAIIIIIVIVAIASIVVVVVVVSSIGGGTSAAAPPPPVPLGASPAYRMSRHRRPSDRVAVQPRCALLTHFPNPWVV